MVIHPKKEEHQRLQLFPAEYSQVVRASQDEQGGDEKEAAKSLDDTTGEAQERGNQRDTPARRLKQVIKESCHSDLARHFDEVDCETQLKQAPVCQYVDRRSRCVAVYHKAAAHETLGEYSRQYGEEIILASNRSDVSAIRPIITSVPMVVSPLREKQNPRPFRLAMKFRPPLVHRRCKAVRDASHAVQRLSPSPRPAPERWTLFPERRVQTDHREREPYLRADIHGPHRGTDGDSEFHENPA